MFAVERKSAPRVQQMQKFAFYQQQFPPALLLPCSDDATVSRWGPWKMGQFTFPSFHLQPHYTSSLSVGSINRWHAKSWTFTGNSFFSDVVRSDQVCSCTQDVCKSECVGEWEDMPSSPPPARPFKCDHLIRTGRPTFPRLQTEPNPGWSSLVLKPVHYTLSNC